MNIFRKNLNDFIMKIGYKYSSPFQSFTEWRMHCLEFFSNFLNKNLNSKDYTYFNLSKDDEQDLNKLQEIFVFVPVDKAAANYAII